MEEHLQFKTPREPCPYLPNREWTLDVRFVAEVSPDEHEAELAAGRRRFGATYFEPACAGCTECTPLRLVVADFKPSRSQRRVLRRNHDVDLEIGTPTVDDERLDLYQRFHQERHATVGWPAPRTNLMEYFESFVANVVPTHEFRYRLGGKLVALAYVDESPNAFSSQYAFHDPEYSRRSLGTFDVLTEVETAVRWKKTHLYLGYYVRDCRSMAYKAQFKPYETLVEGRWCAARCSQPPSGPSAG